MSFKRRAKLGHGVLALLLVPMTLLAVVPAAEANNVTFGLSFGLPIAPPVVVGPPPVVVAPPAYYPPAYYPPAYYPAPYYPAPYYYAPPPAYYYAPGFGFFWSNGWGHQHWRH